MARRNDQAPYWIQLREAERRIIEFALEHGRSLRQTALLLGVSPNFLSERTRELGVKAPESKPGPKPGTKMPKAQPALRIVPEGAIHAPDKADQDEWKDDDTDKDEFDENDEDEDEDELDEDEDELDEDDDEDNSADAQESGN